MHRVVDQPALQDPVCGMSVNVSTGHQAEHDGQSYYFCIADCLDKFKQFQLGLLYRQCTVTESGKLVSGIIRRNHYG